MSSLFGKQKNRKAPTIFANRGDKFGQKIFGWLQFTYSRP